jgi:hypothetical protein
VKTSHSCCNRCGIVLFQGRQMQQVFKKVIVHLLTTANATTYLKHQRVSFVEECLFKQFCYNCSITAVHDLHISSLSSAHMEAACSISNDQQDVYRLLYFSKIVFCKTSFSLWQHVLEAVSLEASNSEILVETWASSWRKTEANCDMRLELHTAEQNQLWHFILQNRSNCGILAESWASSYYKIEAKLWHSCRELSFIP